MALVSCKNCGREVSDQAKVCPGCGADLSEVPPAEAPAAKCAECGGELPEGARSCPSCGCPVESEEKKDGAEAARKTAEWLQAKGKGRMKPVLLGGIVLVVILAVVMLVRGGSGLNFKKLYDKYCDPVWASVGSDNSYLSVDTNPRDEDDNGLAYPAAYTAIKNINQALGLPDSLINDMGETTGADGRQSESFDKLTVSWRYHPDKGLEVTYKKNK